MTIRDESDGFGGAGVDTAGDVARAELIMSLRARGIDNVSVLTAIEQIPRHIFLPRRFESEAWEDRLVPIACGQTASRILEAATLAVEARIQDGHNLLEVGTGSGYLTAILARLAERVLSVERYRRLVDHATDRLLELGSTNVVLLQGDGLMGLSEYAPFDRIVLGGSCDGPPDALLEQLRDGGELLATIGSRGGDQTLTRFVRSAGHVERQRIATFRLSPLLPGRATQM